MCTVTFIPSGDKIFISSNRDEKLIRKAAIPPRIYPSDSGELLYPKDGMAGGTWIAAHENGNAIVLLNGAFEPHKPEDTYRKSRGIILLDIFAAVSPFEAFENIDLDRIEPFTIVIWEAGRLIEARWNGERKFHKTLDSAVPHIWSSVTLYDPVIIRKRESWFYKWLQNNSSPSQQSIIDFHSTTGDGDNRNDLCMNRDNLLRTISITSLELGHEKAFMNYYDCVNNLESTVEFIYTKNYCRQVIKWIHRLSYKPFFIKLFNWEYWSFNTVYIPIYVVWVLLCIRARSFFFFAAANPSIENGGFLNESKKDVYRITPIGLQPKTMFFSIPSNAEQVIKSLELGKMQFPLIGKPDIGGRGRGIKALMDEQDVKDYVKKTFLDFHIQEFVPYKNEVGIFYYRLPGEQTGNISGIVTKEFLKVTGDGKSTVRQLLEWNKRAILQMPALEKVFGSGLDQLVPDSGEEKTLVPYGNHARGCKFLDHSNLIDEQLVGTIDQLCKQIQGFYFGRLDIRYDNWEDLKQGKKFSIIEVNGAGSEPTHMYDPRHSIFFAWQQIIRHWYLLWKISRKNHRLGYKYLSLQQGIQMFRDDTLNSGKLAAMSE